MVSKMGNSITKPDQQCSYDLQANRFVAGEQFDALVWKFVEILLCLEWGRLKQNWSPLLSKPSKLEEDVFHFDVVDY